MKVLTLTLTLTLTLITDEGSTKARPLVVQVQHGDNFSILVECYRGCLITGLLLRLGLGLGLVG